MELLKRCITKYCTLSNSPQDSIAQTHTDYLNSGFPSTKTPVQFREEKVSTYKCWFLYTCCRRFYKHSRQSRSSYNIMHTKTMSADATWLNAGYKTLTHDVQHFHHVQARERISSSGHIQISGYQQPGWSYSSDPPARLLKNQGQTYPAFTF